MWVLAEWVTEYPMYSLVFKTRYWMWYIIIISWLENSISIYFFTFPSGLSYWYSERHKLRSSFTTRILVYFQPSMRKYLVIIAHRPPIYPIAVDNWVSFSLHIARTLFCPSIIHHIIHRKFYKAPNIAFRIARIRWTEPQATSLHIAIAFSYAMANSGWCSNNSFRFHQQSNGAFN